MMIHAIFSPEENQGQVEKLYSTCNYHHIKKAYL